jgi:hypothetical protein
MLSASGGCVGLGSEAFGGDRKVRVFGEYAFEVVIRL